MPGPLNAVCATRCLRARPEMKEFWVVPRWRHFGPAGIESFRISSFLRLWMRTHRMRKANFDRSFLSGPRQAHAASRNVRRARTAPFC